MNDIIPICDDFAQLPDQADYSIDSTSDVDWTMDARQIEHELSVYWNIAKEKLFNLATMTEYHHGLNRHHLYIYELRLLNQSFMEFIRCQATGKGCFFELECYDKERYLGLISVSKRHIVFDSMAQASGLTSIPGLVPDF